jgi:hypothetical protein
MLSFFWILTALLMCALIGIGFGVYPAWKAPASIPSKRFATSRTSLSHCTPLRTLLKDEHTCLATTFQ